jgi:hypothetical protein
MDKPGIPQFDLLAANAVQSLFVAGVADPWSRPLAADFVDFLLWHDRIRYPATMRDDSGRGLDDIVVPPIVADLQRREPGWLMPEMVLANEPRVIQPDLLEPALRELTAFAANNPRQIKAFLALHDSSWIGDQIRSRWGDREHYIFDVPALVAGQRADRLAAMLGVPVERVYYLLDKVLKYLVYAERARGGFYLAHPLRSKQLFHFVGATAEPIEPSAGHIPFRLGPVLVDLARSRGQDWFTSSLHETRGYLHDEGLADLRYPGAVSRDALRKLAARFRLPARVRQFHKVERATSVASAGTGLVGSLASTSIWPAVAGSALTIAAEVWQGQVPGGLSRVRWLQWMFEWPLEQQAP